MNHLKSYGTLFFKSALTASILVSVHLSDKAAAHIPLENKTVDYSEMTSSSLVIVRNEAYQNQGFDAESTEPSAITGQQLDLIGKTIALITASVCLVTASLNFWSRKSDKDSEGISTRK